MPFDPHVHHAIMQQPSDEYPANTVLMVTQNGYQLHDRVVRPSQVIVSRLPDAEANLKGTEPHANLRLRLRCLRARSSSCSSRSRTSRRRNAPSAGKKKLRRLIGPGAAIVFKGSGFYKTDYRSESYKKAAAADKQGDKPSDKTGDKTAAETSSGEKSTEKSAEKSSDKSADTGGKKAKSKEKGHAKK